MIRKSMLVVVLFLMYVSAVQAESPDSPKKDPYFKLGGNVAHDSGDKTEQYRVVLGIEYKNHLIMESLLITGAAELYYKEKKVEIKDESTKTDTAGLGLGSVKFTKFDYGDNGLVPYLKLSLEKIDTEKVTISGVEKKTDRVVAWTFGTEVKLTNRFSVDVYHVWKLSKPFTDEVANETDITLTYTFPF